MDKSTVRQRAINILAEEIHKRRLVVFVGAGCSISAGLPSWKDLTDTLLKKYHIKTKDNNLIRLASRLERDVGTLEFRGKVAESLRTRPDTLTKLHDILVSLDVNLFITTNYDHLLEDSFRKHGYSPTIITEDKELPSIDPSRKTIVKLHGDLDSLTSLVVTLKDYTRFKSQHRAFMEWLNSVVSQNTVLFLGTSFEDPRLKELDEHVLSLFGEFRRQPFIFLKVPRQDSTTLEHDFEIELEDFEALSFCTFDPAPVDGSTAGGVEDAVRSPPPTGFSITDVSSLVKFPCFFASPVPCLVSTKGSNRPMLFLRHQG